MDRQVSTLGKVDGFYDVGYRHRGKHPEAMSNLVLLDGHTGQFERRQTNDVSLTLRN